MFTDQILVRLSAIAYEYALGDADSESALRALGMDVYGAAFDHAGSQGILVRGPGMAALVFRGTEASRGSVSDLRSNLGRPVRWAGRGRAHSGYEEHFSMIRYEARKRAEGIPSATPLYVAGHSMGGALATLYASWVGSGGPDDHALRALVTFGSPKALSWEATWSIHCQVRRYTNGRDFAQYWPPVPGLTHPSGHRIRVDSGGWPGPFSRHGVEKYVEAVDRSAP